MMMEERNQKLKGRFEALERPPRRPQSPLDKEPKVVVIQASLKNPWSLWH